VASFLVAFLVAFLEVMVDDGSSRSGCLIVYSQYDHNRVGYLGNYSNSCPIVPDISCNSDTATQKEDVVELVEMGCACYSCSSYFWIMA